MKKTNLFVRAIYVFKRLIFKKTFFSLPSPFTVLEWQMQISGCSQDAFVIIGIFMYRTNINIACICVDR